MFSRQRFSALLLNLVAGVWSSALASDLGPGTPFDEYVKTMHSAFLPGHLWTAPIILHPEGRPNTYCYNPSFTMLDGVVYSYMRCHSRDYFNPRYRRYHTTPWAMFEGGMNDFMIGHLPYDIADLRNTVMGWTRVEVPLDKVPGHGPLNHFSGLQDARLFTLNGSIWFVASSQEWIKNKAGITDFGPILGFLSEGRSRVEDLWTVEGLPEHCRNIVPLVFQGELYLLDVLMGRLHGVPGPTYRAARELRSFPTLERQGLRGGTNPVLLDNNTRLGFIAHGVYSQSAAPGLNLGRNRIQEEYLHFWVEAEIDSGRVGVSRPFFLLQSGIEFASSMLLVDAEGAEPMVLVGMGADDQEAWMLGASLNVLRAQPRIIDDFAPPPSSAPETAAAVEAQADAAPAAAKAASATASGGIKSFFKKIRLEL